MRDGRVIILEGGVDLHVARRISRSQILREMGVPVSDLVCVLLELQKGMPGVSTC